MSEEIAKTKCPHCYGEVDPRASVCPHCRKNLRTKTAAYQLGSFIVAAGLLLLIGGVFIDSFLFAPAVPALIIGYLLRRWA